VGLEYSFRIAKEYLLRHFLTEVELQNQDVDLKILMSLLKNDMLHVRYEEQVWEAIEDWVKKDPGARKVHFDQLVKCLRVGLVSERFLQKKASEALAPIK
jgi:BTB And C-terminal Kelch